MESKFGSRRKPSSGRGILLAAIAAFIAGGALVGWVVWYNLQPEGSGAPRSGVAVVAGAGKTPGAGLSPSPSPLAQAIENAKTEEAVERVAEQQGGLDQRLAAAEQRLTQLDLQAQAAAGNAARAESLLSDKAIAKREFDEALSAQKELEANANAAQAQYESARLSLADTRVVSPIDGRVSKAEITLGNLVDPSAVLTTVVSLDRIYASFDGDEETYLRVGARAQQGAPVSVRVGLANETGFPHEGRLEFVDNRLDAGTGSVRMRAVFENRGRSLVPGLFARVQLGAADSRQAVLISDRAVSTDQSRKFVVVVDAANKAEYRQVALGPVIDGLRVVRSGLKAGEKIVVNGLQRVRPGEPLAPRMVPMQQQQPALALAAATGAKE